MPIYPSQFGATPPYELLREVERGRLGFDCRLIRSLAARREETLAALARLAREDASQREDRMLEIDDQIFDLYRHFNTIEAAPFYVQEAFKYGEGIPDHVIDAFAALGPKAVEPLLGVYQRASDEQRPDLLFLLAALRTPHPIIEALIGATIGADPYEGALLAGLYGQRSLLGALKSALESIPPTAEFDRKAVQDAIESLDRPSEPMEAAEFDIFALYPDEALPEFCALDDDAIVEFLGSAAEEHRAGAALSLIDSEYSDGIFEKLIETAVKDASPLVRAACYRALGERDDDRARKVLRDALSRQDATPDELAGAVIGLAPESTDRRVHRAILALYEQPATRAAALEAMWRSLNERYIDYFEPNLRSEDDDIRRQAAQGVGIFELSSCAVELIPMMREDAVREAALFGYAMAAPARGRFSVKDAHKLFARIEELAGPFTEDEISAIENALDMRLQRHGRPPEFSIDDAAEHHHNPPARSEKVGRNDHCPCGSGKKYKKCCGASA
jgi:HEAT repeat protein